MLAETHPIWKLAKLCLASAFLYFLLRLNASDYDETERNVLIWSIIGYISTEFAPNLAHVASKAKSILSHQE